VFLFIWGNTAMARDWAKDMKSKINWTELSEEEWDDYFKFQHTKAVESEITKRGEGFREQVKQEYGPTPTIQSVLGNDKTLPSSTMDWIKIIGQAHKHEGLNLNSEKEGDRLRYFSHNSHIQPPIEHFGAQALSIREVTQDLHDKGILAPPWTKDKVEGLHKRFQQISKDLTDNPEWTQHWTDFRSNNDAQIMDLCANDYMKSELNMLRSLYVKEHPTENGISDEKILKASGIESKEAFLQEYKDTRLKENDWPQVVDAKMADLQQQMLQAYRFKLFSKCTFLERGPEETDNQYMMREFRVQDFLQQLNKNMRKIETGQSSVDNIYHEVQQQLSTKLQGNVDSSIKIAKTNVKDGMRLINAIAILDKEITKYGKSKEVSYLGQAGQDTLAQLSEYRDKLQAMENRINLEVEKINDATLPGKDIDQNHLIALIKQSAKDLIESDEAKNLPEIGIDALRNSIASPDAVDNLYHMANTKRAEHFYQFIENNDLRQVNNPQVGLGWITNLRAKREVIQKMYDMVLADNTNFKKPSGAAKFFGIETSSKKQKTLKTLQKLYLDTLQEDMSLLKQEDQNNQSIIDEKFSNLENETIAKTTPPSTFGGVLSNAFSGVIKFFGGKTDKSELKNKIQHIQTVVNNPQSIDASSVDMDIEGLDMEQRIHHRRRQTIDISDELVKQLEQLQTDLPDINTDPEQVVIVINTEEKVQQCELTEMMNDPNQRASLIEKINSIADIPERKVMIENLYSKTFSQQQGDIVLKSSGLNDRFTNIRTTMQDLYLQTIREDWSAQVQQTLDGNAHQSLSQEEAEEIYEQCVIQEFNSEILNPSTQAQQQAILDNISEQQKDLFAQSEVPIEPEPELRDRKKAFV